MAYKAVHINIITACFLKSPRCKYKYTGQIAAIVDQSAGNVIKQIKMVSTILIHCFLMYPLQPPLPYDYFEHILNRSNMHIPRLPLPIPQPGV